MLPTCDIQLCCWPTAAVSWVRHCIYPPAAVDSCCVILPPVDGLKLPLHLLLCLFTCMFPACSLHACARMLPAVHADLPLPMMSTFRCCSCLLLPDFRYALPRERGMFRLLESPSTVTTKSIIQRIVDNRAAFEARNAKKVKSEQAYYETNKDYVKEV